MRHYGCACLVLQEAIKREVRGGEERTSSLMYIKTLHMMQGAYTPLKKNNVIAYYMSVQTLHALPSLNIDEQFL